MARYRISWFDLRTRKSEAREYDTMYERYLLHKWLVENHYASHIVHCDNETGKYGWEFDKEQMKQERCEIIEKKKKEDARKDDSDEQSM